MALFKKPQKVDPFDFNTLLAQTKETLAATYPEWSVFDVSNVEQFRDINLLIISTREVAEEQRLNTNPFSDYKKIIPRIYQTILTVALCPEELEKREEESWETMHINASSVRQITRAIESLEKP